MKRYLEYSLYLKTKDQSEIIFSSLRKSLLVRHKYGSPNTQNKSQRSNAFVKISCKCYFSKLQIVISDVNLAISKWKCQLVDANSSMSICQCQLVKIILSKSYCQRVDVKLIMSIFQCQFFNWLGSLGVITRCS